MTVEHQRQKQLYAWDNVFCVANAVQTKKNYGRLPKHDHHELPYNTQLKLVLKTTNLSQPATLSKTRPNCSDDVIMPILNIKPTLC